MPSGATALRRHAMSNLRSRFRGAFLGCALGDAFGRPLEGASARDLRAARAVEQRAERAEVWAYSDDTEMTLGVAESLLARRGVDPEHLLRTMATRYDPARGYGHGTRQVFEALARGVRWRRAASEAWAEGSRGNGAAARVAPVACLYHRDRDLLAFTAQASAAVTHAHPVARIGCLLAAQALAAVLACDESARFDATAFVRELRGRVPSPAHGFDAKLARVEALLAAGAAPEQAAGELGCGVTADEAVPLALYGFARWGARFEDVVTNLARCGGDVDTIGAMGGALAGALLGDDALPRAWLERLESGARGREYVARLADEVFALWERSHQPQRGAGP